MVSEKKSAGRKNWKKASACLPMEALESRLLFSVLTVTSLADDGSAGTLRWAVNQANQSSDASNTINFAAGISGTINLSQGELELTGGDTAIGGPGASMLSVSAGGMNNVLRVDFGATAAISGLTITGGAGVIGAGLDNSGTTSLSGVVFSDNNAAGGVGGAVFTSGSLTASGCSFLDNAASSGGAIYCNSGALDVDGCTFAGNLTDTAGGAIYTDFAADYVDNSTFTANTSAQGGALFVNSGSLTGVNDTVFGNTAQFDGAGLHIEPGAEATLYNTILSGNKLVDGSAADLAGSLDQGLAAGEAASAFNLIGLGNVNLGPLADNGGTTETMALLSGSPALDAGSGALALGAGGGALASDQRGGEFVRASGAAVDIGAFEFQVPAPPPNPTPSGNETLTVTPASGEAGRFAQLSATLLDASGKAEVHKKVVFMVDGTAAGVGYTNSSGVAISVVCLGKLAPGEYATAVTASFAGDAHDAAIGATGSLTVTDPPIIAGFGSVSLTGASATAGALFAQFRPGAAAADYTATVDFGDGSGQLAATVSAAGPCHEVFKVSAAHAYAAVTVKTTFTVTITITSKYGATKTVTEKVTLSPPPVSKPVNVNNPTKRR